jgi:hypothetical protein
MNSKILEELLNIINTPPDDSFALGHMINEFLNANGITDKNPGN